MVKAKHAKKNKETTLRDAHKSDYEEQAPAGCCCKFIPGTWIKFPLLLLALYNYCAVPGNKQCCTPQLLPRLPQCKS
jgi:hypothetical protein